MPLQAYDPALFGEVADTKSPGAAPAGGLQPYDAKLFGDDVTPVPDAEDDKPKIKSSALGAASRDIAQQAGPFAVGLRAGAAAYAPITALAAPTGPAAPFIGAVGSGIVGIGAGVAASYAQQKTLDAVPEARDAVGLSPEQLEADREQHPVASRAGLALNLAAARPTTAAFSLLKTGATAVAKEAGKKALATGAFNAAMAGGLEAGTEYARDGKLDAGEIALQSGIGLLGQKETRLGRMLAGRGNDTAPSAAIPNDKPADLLALPKPYDVPHTDNRVFTASETGLVSADDSNIRRAAMEKAPTGTQGDLFALGGEDTTQVSRDPVRPPQEAATAADVGGPAPIPMDGAGQPSLFTAAPTAGVAPEFGPVEVRRAVIGGAKPDAYGLKLAQKVHGFLKDGDTVAAADHLNTEADNLEFADLKPKTIDARKGQIDRAKQLVASYASKLTNAMAEEAVQQPRPEPANNVAPAPVEPSVAAIREDNAARTAEEAKPKGPTPDETAHANQVADDGRRASILKHVLDDPDTISPVKRFAALLKRQNLDAAARDYEKEEIINHLVRKGRLEEAKTAFKDLTETGHPPDENGTAALEALIPERVEKPAAAATPKTPAPVEKPTPEFKLEGQTEGDLQRIEAARVRREGKAERRETAAEEAKPAAKQGEMFTPKGNPTKVAAAAAKRPAIPKDVAPVAAKPVVVEKKPAPKRPPVPKDKPVAANPMKDPDFIRQRAMEESLNAGKAHSEYMKGVDEALGNKPFRDQTELNRLPAHLLKAYKDGWAYVRKARKDADNFVPTKEKFDGKEVRGQDAPVRSEKSEDGRQGRQAPDESRKGQDEGLLEYAAVKKRADAAVSARSITPKQHGMVEAAIAAKSHTPEELGKELDKLLERSAEKPFRAKEDVQRTLPKHINDLIEKHLKANKELSDNTDAAGRVQGKYKTAATLTFRRLNNALKAVEPDTEKRLQILRDAYAADGKTSREARAAADADMATTSDHVSSPRTLEVAKSGGTLHDVLEHIVEASPNAGHRTLAKLLSRLIAKGDVKLRMMNPTEEDLIRSKGVYFGDKKEIALSGRRATNEVDATLLHEAIHSLTEGAIEHMTAAGREFVALFNAYKKLKGSSRWDHFSDPDAYGFKDAHEFMSEFHTNENFRAILDKIKEQGQPSLFTRALNVIRRMLGLQSIDPLKEVYALEASATHPDRLAEAAQQSKDFEATPEMVRAKIDAAPKEQREPLRLLARITSTKATKFLSTMAMGNHMYDMGADRGMTYARVLEREEAGARAASNAIVQPHLKLIERARNLPQETVKEINRLGQDSTSKGEWAFYPSYLREAVPDINAPGGVRHEPNRKLGMQVKVNPELNARYKALPPEARKAFTEMFRLTHDRLYDEKAAVMEHVTTSYDGLIADAKAVLAKTTDIKKRGELMSEIKQYNADKRTALSSYDSLLGIDPNTPYLPLNRNGNWVVTAKSDAYMKAEAAGDTDALAKMQKDPKHYFVDFAGSQWEGHTLARAIGPQYGEVDKNVFVVERNKAADKLYAGRDMTAAVTRLENMAKQADAPLGMRALINELKLKTLAQNSIRRSEMRRLNVAAGDLDMLRNVMSHGRSAAHFIGNLHHAEKVQDALTRLKKEVDYPGGKQTLTGRDDRQAVVNAITARHENNLSRPGDDDFATLTANKVTSLASVYMLAVKPSYYVQQLLQSWMYSHPHMAARFGYGAATKAMGQAYKVVAGALDADRGYANLKQIDLSKLPAKYRALADHLYQNGILDVGINTEMGGSNASQGLASVGENVMDKIRGMSRKVEAINRLTAGIAQYDLDMAHPTKSQLQHDAGAYDAYKLDFERLKDVQGHDFQPLTKEQFTAADNAVRVVRQSHGDLSMANSPQIFRSAPGRIALQYKKFSLIMAGMMGREVQRSFFNKSVTPMERTIARKTLGYLLGHTALMAGASGSIGYNVIKMIYDNVMSSENDPHDMEADVRKAIGDPALADLILKGAPALAGADLSGTLGMGNLLSVAPYADLPKDRKSLGEFALAMAGPGAGLVARGLDGLNYMHQGDYYKMAEDWTPRGISDGVRAFRESQQGVTNKKGETLVPSSDVPTMATVWRALGFQSVDQANRSAVGDIKYKQDEVFKQRVIDVKRDYAKATDASDKAKARMDWKELQDARVAHGLKRQPLGDLLKVEREKSKRERDTMGGMQYSRRDRGEVEELTNLFGTDDEEDDVERDPILRDALTSR